MVWNIKNFFLRRVKIMKRIKKTILPWAFLYKIRFLQICMILNFSNNIHSRAIFLNINPIVSRHNNVLCVLKVKFLPISFNWLRNYISIHLSIISSMKHVVSKTAWKLLLYIHKSIEKKFRYYFIEWTSWNLEKNIRFDHNIGWEGMEDGRAVLGNSSSGTQ